AGLTATYGDITKVPTTGASEKTARQDKLTVKGVEASNKLAETDLKKMDQYKSIITKVGHAKQMDPAVIAAIISRESRAGAALVNGLGDKGNASSSTSQTFSMRLRSGLCGGQIVCENEMKMMK
uniref:Lysozyme g n=1 Tax=Astyanax mexicanus TaxID=7994 RepID=A0A8B9R3X7_ASTMX